jgi:hypothetical protein
MGDDLIAQPRRQLANPAQSSLFNESTANPVTVFEADMNGGQNCPVQFVVPVDPSSSPTTVGCPCTVLNGSNGERLRTPTTFKSVSTAAAGATALWTPTSGKKFRVMGWTVLIPSTTTTAAGSTITLQDSAATVFTVAVIGTTTATIAYNSGAMYNGYLSVLKDNVLNINCSAALTAGNVLVNVWGTEE